MLGLRLSPFSSVLQPVFLPFLISRGLIFLILIIFSQYRASQSEIDSVNLEHPRIELTLSAVTRSVTQVLAMADAGWYIEIARRGYDQEFSPATKQRNWPFFPFFPGLLALLTYLIPSYTVSGTLISNISFFVSLALLHKIALRNGLSKESASRALWLLCFFPTSYFFSIPYSESLFLLLVSGSFFLIESKRSISSALLFTLATATRPTGLFLLPAFALFLKEKGGGKLSRVIPAVLIAPLGALIYMAYLYQITGDPLAFASNQRAWGRGDIGFFDLVQSLAAHPGLLMVDWNFLLLNSLCALLAILTAFYLLAKRHYSFALFLLIPVAIALSTGSVQSMGRFVLVLFPMFFALADICDTPSKERLILSLFATFLGIMTLLYATLVTAAMA